MRGFVKSWPRCSVLLSLLFAGVALADGAADKPVVEGPEGKRAFDDLATFYARDRNGEAVPPFSRALRLLESSPFPAERAQQGKYLLALAAQSLADESNGRVRWQPSFAWGGGMESRARELRGWLAHAVAERTTAVEALDLALWLIEHDPLTENQRLGAGLLCRIDAPKTEEAIGRLLAGPHPNPSVLVPILEQASRRKLTGLAPEVRRLATHYRLAVRTAAQNTAAALGISGIPPYRPEEAFTPVLDRILKDVAAMAEVEVPKDAPWKNFRMTRPSLETRGETYVELLPGWLLGETADTLDVLPITGMRTRLEKKLTKVEPSSLQEAATLLLETRNKPDGEQDHPAAGRFSRMGMLTAQFEPRFISVQEALVSAWLYQRGDKKTAAAILFPCIDASPDDRSFRDAIRELLGTAYHLEMLEAYADARDYDRALTLAKHLSGPLFDGYWYQGRATELAEQLPKRRDDFKSFRLPRPEEWSEMKKKLTRPQQIEYLATRLRLLKGYQWGQPGGVTYDVPHYEHADPSDPQKGLVINPYMELCGMHLEIADLPALVPFLADESFTLTYGYWRDFHPGRDLHRVNRPVAAIVNEVAKRDLAQLDAFSAMDAQGKQKQLDTILQRCRQNAGRSRADIVLHTMMETADWHEFEQLATEALRKREAAAVPVLVKRFDDFTSFQEQIARLCYQFDSAETAAPARKWLALADDGRRPAAGVRFWSALILLRHGDKEKLEGLNELETILAQDKELRRYPSAIAPLIATKQERAMLLACGILKKQKFTEQPGWISDPVLQRLLLAGRRECLDYLLMKLDSEVPRGSSSGVHDGKKVQRTLVDGDAIALVIASWHGKRAEYDTLAPDDDRRARRKQLKMWLKEQFTLIKTGREPQMQSPGGMIVIESAGPFLDAP